MLHWNLVLAVPTGIAIAAALAASVVAVFALADRMTDRAVVDYLRQKHPGLLPPDRFASPRALRRGRRTRVLRASGATALAAALLAVAIPAGPPPTDRSEFGYEGGRFVQVADRIWVERRDDGPSSEFEETDRCAEYVQIYDAHRRLTVRLFADHAAAYSPEGASWIGWPGSDGGWVNPRAGR